MINCIAIDDEPLALAQLKGYISRVPFLRLCATCQDAFEAMKVMSEQPVELLFVDINMPDLNGMDFVRSLHHPPLIIFTTAYAAYAVDGFKVDAVDYLLKPFSFSEFLAAADRARKRVELHLGLKQSSATLHSQPAECGEEVVTADGALFVKSDYRVTRIELQHILYIEGMSEYVKIYLESDDKPLMPLLSMKRLEEILPPTHFMRVHRSYIVNLSKITEVTKSRILFGKVSIPIADSYKDSFMEYITKHLLR